LRLHAAWRNPSYCQYASLRYLIDSQSPYCFPSTCLRAWCVSSDCLPPDCLTPDCLSPGRFCVSPAKHISMLLPFWLSASLLCVNYMPSHRLVVVAAFHLSVCELDAFDMAVCLPWLFVAWLYVIWLRLVAVCPAVSHCHSASESLLTVAWVHACTSLSPAKPVSLLLVAWVSASLLACVLYTCYSLSSGCLRASPADVA